MSSQDIGNLIQIAVVLAAVGAAVVALIVSAKDRKNAQKIAEDDRSAAAAVAAEDRREALRQAHLMFELETLTRLLENLNKGGSSDREESKRLGSEALTLIGALGRERIPKLWDERVGDDAKLQGLLGADDVPAYRKPAIETQLAVNEVLREIRGVQRS
ncbi:hypothetical protein [Microbacterium sp. NPDC087868]|uniref:hypothetical protein n=1 Tax=Microbacterium sp. NPDC087868 TaxID=3364195 RepID=UPI00384CE824